ncbi:MAG TPA: BrnT family toxin [Acidobacteriaceae bacterium]
MRYEWDERKNRENWSRHRISFEDAALVFDDERCLIYPDRADATGELRWHAIGTVPIGRTGKAVLLVVHAYRENIDGEEIIRIISARETEKHERRRYQKQEAP